MRRGGGGIRDARASRTRAPDGRKETRNEPVSVGCKSLVFRRPQRQLGRRKSFAERSDKRARPPILDARVSHEVTRRSFLNTFVQFIHFSCITTVHKINDKC